MHLFRLLTLPYVRRRRTRAALMVAGIAMGVAVFVAMHAANRSVLAGFRDTVARLAGRTVLQVSAGEAGLSEDVLDRVRDVRGVRSAVPIIEATVETGLTGEGSVLVLAVDLVGDAALRDYDVEGKDGVIDDPLEFLAQPDSIIVTRELADRHGLRIGGVLPVRTMDGLKQFTVRGVLSPGGMGGAFGGNLAVMDVYAAQRVFGRGRTFDRVDLTLTDDGSVERVQSALQRALGPAYAVEPPERRSRNLEALLSGYAVLVNVTSALALVIGMFVIYNVFAMAVTERRSDIGILRALGATRGQVRALFLTESAVAGAVGAACGIALGQLAVGVFSRATAGLVTALSGEPQAGAASLVGGDLLAAAAAGGVAVSVAAAWLPAAAAARLDPVLTLQKGRAQVLTSPERRWRLWAAAGLSLAALACCAAGPAPAFSAGYLLAVTACLLMVPSASTVLTRLLRTPLRWLSPVEGALAADSLLQAPRRTSAAVAGLMLALAAAVGVAGVARATFESINDWASTVFNADLLVSTSPSLNARSFHFPASLADDLERMPGVAAVQSVRSIVAPVNGWPVMIVGLEMARSAVLNRERRVVAGDRQTMYRQAGAGSGAIVSESFALLQQRRLGDTVELAAPLGSLQLPIVGIFRDYSNQTGVIYIDLAVYRQYWRDDSLDLVHVYLRPGLDPRAARQAVFERFGSRQRLFVLLNGDVRAYIGGVGRQWFSLAYAQIAVAVLVALLGIVNALTVSIVDRRREIGVLRAIGGLTRQVRRTLWLEAVTIALVGTLLGVALGAVNLAGQLELVRRSVLAMPLDYRFPFGVALWLFPVTLGAAWCSSLAPAAAAVRVPLIAALEYE